MDSHREGPPRSFTPSTASLPAWLTTTARPLSDIRETTESSLLETSIRRKTSAQDYAARPSRIDAHKYEVRAASTKNRPELRQGDLRSELQQTDTLSNKRSHSRHGGIAPRSRHGYPLPFRSQESNGDLSSVYSISAANVPPRSSSNPRHRHSTSNPPPTTAFLQPPKNRYHCILNRGQSQSPIKEAAHRLDPNDRGRTPRMPSKTIVKVESASSNDILDHPYHPHPRLKVYLQVAAPLFVGGSSVEGSVRIIVDEADRLHHRKTLTLERVSVDLLGIEELSGAKRNVFLSLGNELVDFAHPPPEDLVESQQPITPQERSWILVPSVSTLPFLITLPLEVGPPRFISRHAKIRYILCATLTIKDAGRQLCVRCSQDTEILSVYDPEKALISLPSPLTSSDEHFYRGHSSERIILTAGLHRQVWVSGTTIFADVHIINNSHKTIKKVELHVERIIICYRHAVAATMETSASPARLFDQVERSVIERTVIKPGHKGWSGVLPHTTELRTCDLELPRDHATIKCNKYFEVRYSLNIIIGTSHKKLVTVQLPIILIHMNSLDVPTNSVAQVAAAIEQKRGARSSVTALGSPRLGRRPSKQLQGRAFNAPRMQSLERERARQADLRELVLVLDASPRKHNPRKGSFQSDRLIRQISTSFTFKTPPSNRKGRVFQNEDADELRRRLRHMRSLGSNVTNQSIVPNRNTSRASSSAMSSYPRNQENARTNGGSANRLGGTGPERSFEGMRPKWASERWKPPWRP